jgi:hypothetical protein
MTDMTMISTGYPINAKSARRWGLRGAMAALAATVLVATVFGPGPVVATRLGAGETVGFATVSAADTITSSDVLADVPAAVRDRVSRIF